jgi:CheY-like chemotaxis protein
VDLGRAVFERTRLALAHCQAVYQDEETVDAVFLETNPAFETATGLSQVAGRRFSEALPDFLESSPGLLATLGRVAGSGCPESFETFVQALDSWFAMHVFSPAPGQFVAALENITERRQTEEEAEAERHRLEERLNRVEALQLNAARAGQRLDRTLAAIQDSAAERQPASSGADQAAFQRIGQFCLEARDGLTALVTPSQPAPEPTPCPAPREAPAPAAAKPSPVPRKVLLVDDDEDVRFLMGRMLRKAGVFQVRTAASGEEALLCLAEDAPELVILDQNMPGMNGVQTLGRIRERHPELPVLFSSGHPGLLDLGGLDQAKVAVIAKPFTLAEIQARLRQFEQTS